MSAPDLESEGTIRLYSHRNGDVTGSHWPRRLFVSDDCFVCARPDLISRDGDILRLTLANGEATYRVVGWLDGVTEAERVSCITRPYKPEGASE